MPTLNLFQASAIIAFSLNCILGVLVFGVNPTRRANRHFLVASGALAIWMGAMILGSFSSGRTTQIFWIRQAHFTSVLLPLAFDLLRLGIAHAKHSWRDDFRSVRVWLLLLLFAFLLAQSPFFVIGVHVRPDGFLQPVFGPGRILYVAIWIFTLATLVSRYTRDLWFRQGVERMELQFILLGSVLAVLAGLVLGHLAPMITGREYLIELMPLCVIFLDVTIAYGIATHHIMNVTEVLRRATSYALLACYLVLIYLAIFLGLNVVLSAVMSNEDLVAHIAATLAVAFSVAPAHGWMQQFANRLFINLQPVDIGTTIQKARQAMMSIGTTDELLARFAEIAREATGTDRVEILLASDGSYVQTYPREPPEERELTVLRADDPLVQLVRDQHEPVSLDVLRRLRPSQLRIAAGNRLDALHAALAVAVRTKGRLEGILLLGRRLSGKVYDANDQQGLQFFCDQIGVSLDNARLYTEVQNSKLYNDILLDSLVSGVIAANVQRRITVFNREAQRITGLSPATALGETIDCLPAPIAAIIDRTLQTDSGVMDEDLSVARGEDRIPIRLSSSGFRGHTGERMGVLVVINDMTIVRKLEEQVRRTDRLASLGTLSAGMAHEIKNPLVSIKTFTQLLPERHDDEEFRQTFSELLGKEVTRIDSIVNRLLHFSRPSKAELIELHLHDVIENSLRLVEQQLRRFNIHLEKAFQAECDCIQGDADQLSQTLINFFLNAVEAMGQEGTLTVATSQTAPGWLMAREPNGAGAPCIRLSITDTGHGIAKEDLNRIFDPFFTTKTNGTGLGLSVSHGIIQEHGATVDVESKPDRGTTFHIVFPLVQREEEAAT